MTDQKPISVFVRLPLSDEQIAKEVALLKGGAV